MEVYRTGDDTSGRNWECVRRRGVNTLAFRLAQDKNFYRADADCVGIMGKIPWEMNRQWAEILARSGTPFFTSIDPDKITDDQKSDMKNFMAIASRGQSSAEPLDWLYNACPRRWKIDGKEVSFNWNDKLGVCDYREWTKEFTFI